MDNKLTQEILNKQSLFTGYVKSCFKNNDYSFLKEIEKNGSWAISANIFLYLANELLTKKIEPEYSSAITSLIHKDYYAASRVQDKDVRFKKLSLIGKISDKQTRLELFKAISEDLLLDKDWLERSGEILTQKKINSIWLKFNKDNSEIINLLGSYLNQPELLTSEKIEVSIIKINTEVLASTFNTNKSNVMSNINSFIKEFDNKFKEHSSFFKSEESEHMVVLFKKEFDKQLFEKIFNIALQKSIKQNKIIVNFKKDEWDVIFQHEKLDLLLDHKPQNKIQNSIKI